MDPFRHCHRNSVKGLCSPSLPSLRSPCCFAPSALRTSDAHLLLRRTLKTAHPDFLHPVKTNFNFPFGLTRFSFLRSSPRPISISKLKPYDSYTADLSPGSPPGVLLLSNGTLILEVGFTLRCLQRLSHPHFASLLCRWHDNSCTSDASTPVLSY